jgi:hypothetical protein
MEAEEDAAEVDVGLEVVARATGRQRALPILTRRWRFVMFLYFPGIIAVAHALLRYRITPPAMPRLLRPPPRDGCSDFFYLWLSVPSLRASFCNTPLSPLPTSLAR